MKYCQWSSLDYGCDLVVRQVSSNKIRINVAHSRYLPQPKDPRENAPAGSVAHMEYISELGSRVRTQMEPIGGPYDGQEFTVSNADCIELLEKLGRAGYRFPHDLIEQIQAYTPSSENN